MHRHIVKEEEKMRKISKTAVLIYVVAAILLMSFALSTYNVTVYIQSLLEAKQLTLSTNWLDIVSYYVNNTTLYLALAALLFGMGYVVNYLKSLQREDAELEMIEETEENSEDVQETLQEAVSESI